MYQSDMYQRDMYRTTESDVRARRHSNKERPGEKGAEGGPPKLTHPQLGSTARGSRVPLSRFEGLTNTLGGVKSRLGPDPYRRPPFNLKREKFMASPCKRENCCSAMARRALTNACAVFPLSRDGRGPG